MEVGDRVQLKAWDEVVKLSDKVVDVSLTRYIKFKDDVDPNEDVYYEINSRKPYAEVCGIVEEIDGKYVYVRYKPEGMWWIKKVLEPCIIKSYRWS